MKRLLLGLLLSTGLWAQPLAQPDRAWDRVFQRLRGWNGADGAYSVGLRGGWTGWLFSDTFVGKIAADGSRHSSHFLHNSWARIHGSRPSVNFFSSQELAHSDGANWFWVYQPVLDSGQQGWLFLGEFATTPDGPEGLNFQQVGTWLAPLDWSGNAPKLGKKLRVPHFEAKPALNFGAAVLADPDFFYVYGTRDFGDHKEVMLARVPGGELDNFSAWQFWPGWGRSLATARPILTEASNELSVFRHRNEVRLLTQVGSEVRLYRGKTPDKFSEFAVVARLPEEDGVSTYNAKAHPELGWPLLITYNRNAFPPERVMEKADRYRPRCLTLAKDPWLP
ncbi:hypothetical protein ABS71_08725 [bacterium SCN 62-11]|nr:DUF4185 domain-containing protein [Candidatus Eremiobacteraeota bacterium]ODT69982.1 MAG: hypothetical protein ABS71_08725 [bacterium SCN 62-11]